ncbi:MAG TPA: NAD(P)/FAD-dependent oxidoreductase [Acidimicrobiales bacterium]|jgi:cation diffusion facilitator CzcD-associated flavoprotein CzcO|nr:NAD(P)/FAD-dependent oxidoreductase [Acidimicrobiales bacterium]
MTDVADAPLPTAEEAEHLDVLIIGAGLSGIGAGYRLQTMCPGTSYAILEGRSSLGGTWDLFRYPGIRSDSDMFTLGYPFRPWTGEKSIADGADIWAYIDDTAREYGIDRHIRFEHRAVRASWSSDEARWTVEATAGPDAEPTRFTCRFLYLCAGYYSYERGYQPDFPGQDDFAGELVHPQAWPEDLDYAGKRVVIIGSGATAVTLVPAMAGTAEHVTMLQRSPTYIATLPGKDPLANLVRRFLPAKLAHSIVRWKNVLFTSAFYQFCRRRPKAARRVMARMVAAQLPKGYDPDPDFNPTYDPWDQRLCLVPDGDLFRCIKKGTADIATDTIERFTPTGIDLASGRHLDADIIVSATGLNLQAGGGMAVEVDGRAVSLGETFVYKGFMLSDVPNLAMCVGYTNASWTLRADISSQEVCKVINHLDRHGYRSATPTVREHIEKVPILDLSSGYVQRGKDVMPQQGTKSPWVLRQNFILDLLSSKLGDVTEGLVFDRPAEREPARR